MLVLTRRDGEAIAIGPDITITLVESGRGKSRIGIQAPRDVNVRRSELPDREPIETAWGIVEPIPQRRAIDPDV